MLAEENFFETLTRMHQTSGHNKARTFQKQVLIMSSVYPYLPCHVLQVQDRHGTSVPRWVAEVFAKCCPRCVKADTRKTVTAGHWQPWTGGSH